MNRANVFLEFTHVFRPVAAVVAEKKSPVARALQLMRLQGTQIPVRSQAFRTIIRLHIRVLGQHVPIEVPFCLAAKTAPIAMIRTQLGACLTYMSTQ